MRVLIADDHQLVRETMGAFLAREPDLECDGAGTLDEALTRIRRRGRFDLVLLDWCMPGMNGLEGLGRAVDTNGAGSVALMSGAAPAAVAREAIASGAIGFLPKTIPARSLLAAIRFMLAGERYVPADLLSQSVEDPATGHPVADALTRRERQVLAGLCEGRSNKEIGLALDLREVTIKLHVKTLCRKLGARNRTHAAMIAKEAGLH